MKLVLNVLIVAWAGTMLVACALLPKGVDQNLRQSLAMSFTVYGTAWQPALIRYSKLDYCGEPAVAPCRDRVLYAKLYAADAAVANCAKGAVQALNENTELSSVAACIEKVEAAKLAFAQGGLKP